MAGKLLFGSGRQEEKKSCRESCREKGSGNSFIEQNCWCDCRDHVEEDR